MEKRFNDYLATCLKELEVRLAQAHRECMQQHSAPLSANVTAHARASFNDSIHSICWPTSHNSQTPLEQPTVVPMPPGSIPEAPEPPSQEYLTSAEAVLAPKVVRKSATLESTHSSKKLLVRSATDASDAPKDLENDASTKKATDAKALSNDCAYELDALGPSCGSASGKSCELLECARSSIQIAEAIEVSKTSRSSSANFSGAWATSTPAPRVHRSRLDIVPMEPRRSQVDEEHGKNMLIRPSHLSTCESMFGGPSPRVSQKHTHFASDSRQANSIMTTTSNMSCMTDDTIPFGIAKAWALGSMRLSSVALSTIHTGSIGDGPLRKSITLDSNSSFGSDVHGLMSQYQLYGPVARRVQKHMARMVVDPGSPKRLVWDALGATLICYEFVMVPLELMDVPRRDFHEIMSWIIRMFWLFDLPFCFLKAFYHPDGSIEVQIRKIVRKYLRSWMCFDLLVLTLDWVELLLGTKNLTGARIVRTMKAVRLHKIARLMRVIKFRNLPDFLRSLSTLFQSEMFQIMCNITQMMVILVGVSHVLACVFYRIGIDGDRASWTKYYGIESENLGSRYSSAMLWSVSQFTASSDIFPVTGGERAFTVAVMLFGFLVSACVVSSITSSLTHLEIVAAGQSTQISNLRQYLLNNNISIKTSMRVQRNAMFEIEQRTKNAPEGSIELLNVVSEPLRIELHYEIYMPVFDHHIFFSCLNEFNASAMRRVCHTCVIKFQVSRGDVIFAMGEIPAVPCMYFHVSGHISYKKQNFLSLIEKQTVSLHEGDWACEAVIWASCWAHMGTLQCMSPCSLLKLDAEKFQNMAFNFATHDFTRYAAGFVERLNAIPKAALWDLHMEDINVRHMCRDVFPEWKDSKHFWMGVDGLWVSPVSSHSPLERWRHSHTSSEAPSHETHSHPLSHDHCSAHSSAPASGPASALSSRKSSLKSFFSKPHAPQ